MALRSSLQVNLSFRKLFDHPITPDPALTPYPRITALLIRLLDRFSMRAGERLESYTDKWGAYTTPRRRATDSRSAGFQTGCVAVLPACGRVELLHVDGLDDALPIWKSATQQVWKPALRLRMPVEL